ncbi:hypothetical protein D3C72_1645360 [compost metagenome]
MHVAQSDAARHVDLDRHAVLLEFPLVIAAAGKAVADAFVPHQVVGMAGNVAPGQIGGRRHDRHAQAGADRHGHHVFRHRLQQAHARIETRRDDIDKAVVFADIQPDVRVGRQEARGKGHQQHVGRRARRIDAQGAGCRPAEVVHLFERVAQVVQHRQQAFGQALAGVRQRHAARGPVEQVHPQPFFQVADGVADRRSRQAKLFPRAAKAAVPGDRRKGGQVRQVIGQHDYANY